MWTDWQQTGGQLESVASGSEVSGDWRRVSAASTEMRTRSLADGHRKHVLYVHGGHVLHSASISGTNTVFWGLPERLPGDPETLRIAFALDETPDQHLPAWLRRAADEAHLMVRYDSRELDPRTKVVSKTVWKVVGRGTNLSDVLQGLEEIWFEYVRD